MQTTGRRRSARGLTLIEGLICMVILGFIFFMVGRIYIGSLKLFNQAKSEQEAHATSARVIDMMIPTLEPCMLVSDPGPYHCIVVLPRPDPANPRQNYVNAATRSLEQGSEVGFYLSDASGNPPSEFGHPPPFIPDPPPPLPPPPTGTILYRVERPIGGAWGEPKKLAEGVTSLKFTYSPSLSLLELIRAEVTVTARRGGKGYSVSDVGEAYIRNH